MESTKHGLGAVGMLAVPCLAAALLLPSKQCQYFVKYFVLFGGVSLVCGAVLPVLALRPFNVLNLVLIAEICKHLSWLAGVRWTLRGGQHLAEQKACVIVANHQSALDILGMFGIWSVMRKCTAVAKRELIYAWSLGLAAWLCGLVFIDRRNADRAKEAINKAVDTIKKDKVKLWIFPEGTRHNTGEIHPFKKGAFHVAVSAQLPIQPVVYSSYYFLNDRRRTFDSGEVIISALPPIPTEGLTLDDVDDLMQRVRKNMMEEFSRISKEVQANLPPSANCISSKQK